MGVAAPVAALAAVAALGRARLRHRPSRWLLVGLGVALATALPVLAENSATVVAAQALRYGLAELPPGERSLVVVLHGLRESPEHLKELDTTARGQLAGLAGGPVRAQLLSHRIANGTGASFSFGAADDLASAVRLTSGRLPRSCTPTRCEVVVLEPAPGAPADPGLGLVVVGRVARTDPLLLTGSFDPGPDATLLLADGVADAAQLDALQAFQRTYGWVTPADLDRVERLGVDGYLARSVQAGDELYRSRLSLAAPDETLRAEAARAQRSTRRFALLGGASMALLLGFAAIGAIGLRRDHASTVELLRRRGAGRRATGLLTAITAGIPVAVGTAGGLALGAILAGARSRSAGLDGFDAALAAVRAAGPTVTVGAIGAAVVVATTLAVGPPATGRAAGWRLVDAAIAVGAVVAAIGLARGAVTVGALGERTDPLLLALPVIFVVGGGLLAGRIWPAVTTLAAAALPRRAVAGRLGLLGAVRSPVRPVATTAFLAAATGIVAFAGAYQGTLRQGAADQATFAVPLDATVRTGATLQRPLDVAGPAAYAATAPGVTVHPVLRANAGVRVNATAANTIELLGVDPAALERIRSWSTVVGGPDPAAARRLLTPARGPSRAAAPVPPGTHSVEIPVTGDAADLDLTLWQRGPDGRDDGIALTLVTDPARGDRLVGTLPRSGGEGGVFALTARESSFAATRRQHRTGEGGSDAAAVVGRVSLGPLRFGPGPVSGPVSGPGPASGPGSGGIADGGWTGWGTDDPSARATLEGDRLVVEYRLAGTAIVLRAGHGVAGGPLAVLVDPHTAAAATGGLLQLMVSGQPVPARVAGVLPRFPTVGAAFAVADVQALADALDAADPGTGSVSELWLSAGPSGVDSGVDSGGGAGARMARALAAPPFDRLRVDLRQARQDHLAADPLAIGASTVLTGSALLALLVAAVALVLLVVAELRDESAQLYAWESDGVAPAVLRRALFLRAVAVVGVAVPAGVLIGLALTRVAAAVVQVTAVGTTPVPPLSTAASPLWTVAVVGAGVTLGLAAAGVVAATALREPLPRRPEEGLW